ncbi:hypothetical protein KIL84_023127 [Mauremys mutica]|uniref:Uncharacterized protein n=1 Tax=Mauremys mutica TaxID=74926 RepID=A0A9D4APC4_9SAUR|nr:hypothetical protein KIL84_023127 [Mauremys mutica]
MQLPVLWFGVIISQSESSVVYNHHGPNYAWLLFGSTGEKAGHKERFLSPQPCVTQLKKRQFCSLCSGESRDCYIPSSPGTYGAPIWGREEEVEPCLPHYDLWCEMGKQRHPIKAAIVDSHPIGCLGGQGGSRRPSTALLGVKWLCSSPSAGLSLTGRI